MSPSTGFSGRTNRTTAMANRAVGMLIQKHHWDGWELIEEPVSFNDLTYPPANLLGERPTDNGPDGVTKSNHASHYTLVLSAFDLS